MSGVCQQLYNRLFNPGMRYSHLAVMRLELRKRGDAKPHNLLGGPGS